jgi:dihydropteroate synthase
MRSESNFGALHIRGKNLDLVKPKIMGILNTTPDSFSDAGRFISENDALSRIGEMVSEGADIIDVGGESTRPGSDPVTVDQELERVIPILEKALPKYDKCFFSIDTTKFEVAKKALSLGVHMINDVSGFEKEPRFAGLCRKYDAGYILMHSQGDPETMQKNPRYDDIIRDLTRFFQTKLKQLEEEGVNQIVLDPGIGFGKTLSHNLEIISYLDKLTGFGYPLLIGASRKSMIGQILEGRPVNERLAGTIAVHYHCLIKGANILRVHDVKEAKDSVQIFNAVQSAQLKTKSN